MHPKTPRGDLLWTRIIPQLAALGLESLDTAITLLPASSGSLILAVRGYIYMAGEFKVWLKSLMRLCSVCIQILVLELM